MQIVLFEDDRAAILDPLAAAEPAFAISCGGYRLVHLLRGLGTVSTVVRKHLRAVEATTYADRVHPEMPLPPVLFVNARMVPSVAILAKLKGIIDAGREGIVSSGQSIAAALVTRNTVELPRDDDLGVEARIHALKLPALAAGLPLFEYPHDVLRHHLQCCRENFEHRIKHEGNYREVRDGVFTAENVTLSEHVVTDTRQGPVVIDHDAVIGPFTFLRGPVYVGPKAIVNEHAAIKDNVSLGHTTKVGGEVEASVIEPYSNKQHHGYLGHSYVGSWVNLGAGTSNSDLKNTYGPVNMEYGGRKVSTGMQFVGCFIGDYVKTAINTSIFTGKLIGVGSMVYGFVTTNVPAFCNYAQSFGQVTDLPAGVMLAFQQRVFARRKVDQRECDMQLIRDLYEMARKQRQLPDEPLAL